MLNGNLGMALAIGALDMIGEFPRSTFIDRKAGHALRGTPARHRKNQPGDRADAKAAARDREHAAVENQRQHDSRNDKYLHSAGRSIRQLRTALNRKAS